MFAVTKMVPHPGDPELENQINDRLSFKKFLYISFSKPAPVHSTFSHFRSRLSKEAMDQTTPKSYDNLKQRGCPSMKASPLMQNSLNPTAAPSAMTKYKNSKKKETRLRESLIKLYPVTNSPNTFPPYLT